MAPLLGRPSLAEAIERSSVDCVSPSGQPDGLERLGRIVEDLLAGQLAAADVPEHCVAPSDLDPAGPAACLYLSEQHQPVTEVDQLLGLRPVVGPGVGPLPVEAEESLVPAVDGIEVAQRHPLLG